MTARNQKLIKISLLVTGCWLLICARCFAEKITILYTGSTHAALYHCDCPVQPDGGVARRMAKVKELREKNPNVILVDAGGFFAGGEPDEHSQGVQLDKTRTEINLKALELMGYDAVAVGDDEFNFGRDYLSAQIKKSKIAFLSCNLKMDGLKPYLIKKVSGLNVALIGLTNPQIKAKSDGLEAQDPYQALARTISEVKRNKADVVVVLSYLGEEEDTKLITQIDGVDAIICAKPQDAQEPSSKIAKGLLARASRQGRRLGKLDIELENKKVQEARVENIRLSNEIADWPQLKKQVPACFEDSACRKEGLIGKCLNPGKINSSCGYEKPQQISLLVIQPRDIKVVHQEKFLSFLRKLFPGLQVNFVDSDSAAGKSWIVRTQAKLLPVYLIAKEADTQGGFKDIKDFAELKDDYYCLSPRLSGGLIFIGRPRIANTLDVFMGTKGNKGSEVLSLLRDLRAGHKELGIKLHYLAIETQNGFAAPGGIAELEEDMRQVCIAKYQPDKFWDYALCRFKNQDSSWWEVCAEQFGINPIAIKKCALSKEGLDLLRENTGLNKELEMSIGPVFLVNNNEVYAAKNFSRVEELEKLLGLVPHVKKDKD